jgi:hypothetical protein
MWETNVMALRQQVAAPCEAGSAHGCRREPGLSAAVGLRGRRYISNHSLEALLEQEEKEDNNDRGDAKRRRELTAA